MVIYNDLNDSNFIKFCMEKYNNPHCSIEEFNEDINRIKYIKKLITRYLDGGELKERLILNHIIILKNCFEIRDLVRILYLKLNSQFIYIKPFLLLLNICPDKIKNINNIDIIDISKIIPDEKITNILKDI